MEQAKLKELNFYLKRPNGYCVSLYMNTPQNNRRDQLNFCFEMLLREAEKSLAQQMNLRKVQQRVARIRGADFKNILTTKIRSVAIFSDEENDFFVPLSYPLENKTVVAKSYHIRPIEKVINLRHRWMAVHVKEKSITFYRGFYSEIETAFEFELSKIALSSSQTVEALLQNFINTHDIDGSMPIYVVGSPENLGQFIFRKHIKNIFSSSENIETMIKFTAKNEFDRQHDERLRSLSYDRSSRPLIYGIDEAIYSIDNGSLESLVINKTLNRPGSIDWSRRLINDVTHNIPVDCVYDDVIEKALENRLEIITCSREQWGAPFDLVGIPRQQNLNQYNVI